MKTFRFLAIVLVCFSTLFNALANAKPMPDDVTNLDSVNLNMEPSLETDEENIYYSSSLPELTRSKRNRGHGHHHGHHAGFVTGAATGAIIANHNQPDYYAPTYYYPPTYYPSSNYYGDGYYYY